MDNYRIEMAQRRLNRGHIHEKQELKITQAPDVTDVTSEASEIVEQVVKIEEATEDVRSLREIWEQECDVGISYKTFMQRLRQQKWDLQTALHTPKAR